MVRGVFFDLYGTLLLYGDMEKAWGSWLAALHETLAGHGLRLELGELGRACHGLFSGPEPPSGDGLTLYERRIDALARRHDLALDKAALDAIAARTIGAWHTQVEPDPRAKPLLDWLRPRFRLALVTNFDHPPHVHRLLERLELDGLFDCVVVSGAVGTRKPDPAIFDPALAATGLDEGQVAFVGDAPEDVAAAKAAGMTPVCIRRVGAADPTVVVDYRDGPAQGSWPGEPDDAVVIRALDDLRDLVTGWERPGR